MIIGFGTKDSEKRVILEGGSLGTNGTIVKFDGGWFNCKLDYN